MFKTHLGNIIILLDQFTRKPVFLMTHLDKIASWKIVPSTAGIVHKLSSQSYLFEMYIASKQNVTQREYLSEYNHRHR